MHRVRPHIKHPKSHTHDATLLLTGKAGLSDDDPLR
jgi:hypothetical protein